MERDLPCDVLTHMLAAHGTAAASLCSAAGVSSHWRTSATSCWPSKLAEVYRLPSSAGDGGGDEARRRFAVEDGWSQGFFSYEATRAGGDVADVCVDAAAGEAIVATKDGVCERVRLPRFDPEQLCGSPGSPHAHRRYDGRPSANYHPGSFGGRHARQLVASACAGGAVFGREDGSIEALFNLPHPGDEGSDAAINNNRPPLAINRVVVGISDENASAVTAISVVPDGEWRPRRVLSGTADGELLMHRLVNPRDHDEGDDGSNGGGGVSELMRLTPEAGVGVAALAAGPWGGGVSGGSVSVALVGSTRGHVNIVDLCAGKVVGSLWSSCACPPLAMRVLADPLGGGGGGGPARHLYAVSRKHRFTGPGHGDVVMLWDARSLSKVGAVSSRWERIVGMAADGHKLVTAAEGGLISAVDLRTWRKLFSRHTPAGTPALTAAHCDGDRIVAAGGGLLHVLVSRGEWAPGYPSPP